MAPFARPDAIIANRTMHQEQRDARSALHECHFGLWCKRRVSAYWFKAASEEPLVMVRIGAAAFDGVDRHGRINPDGSEMRGDSVENKQVELIMSDRWFR